jgi:hypothetical protein
MRRMLLCGLLALMLQAGITQVQYDATFVHPLMPPRFDPVRRP